jgi:DNA-binding response OmpR family regulator
VRVLIVSQDGVERQRAAAALRLRLPDVEVTEVASPRAGAELLAGGDVDVLVVDGDLQPKGGFSWLYELREEALVTGARRPPAVVLTARVQDRFLADWAGAEAVSAKPVDTFHLADTVAALVVTETV